MRRFCSTAGISALALAVALSPLSGWVYGDGEAKAAIQGHKFCETPLAPAELKVRLERSLAADPSGNRKLEGCRANPLDFLEAWKNEQDAPKRIADLSGFVARFTVMNVEPGQMYWAACIRQDGNGVIVRCVQRTLEPGEKVYGINGVAYLYGNCVNPINLAVAEVVVGMDCLPIKFPGKPFSKEVGGGAIRLAYVGPKALPSKCLTLTRAGVAEPMRGIPNECPPDTYSRKTIDGRTIRVVCDWTDVEIEASRILGVKAEVQNVSGSFYPVAEGENILVIHPEALNGITAFCYEMPDGTFVTYGIERKHFVDGVAVLKPETVFK